MKPPISVRRLWSIAALVTALPFTVPAQPTEDPLEVLRHALDADRQAVVAKVMQFTAAEADAFWPAYHRYRSQMDRVGDGIETLVQEYARLYPDVPDDRAKSMLRDLVKLENEQVSTRASFLRRVARIIPPAKALRLAQVESRLDLAIRTELAALIPLVPIEGAISGEANVGVLYEVGVPGEVAVLTRKITARVAAIDPVQRTVTLVSDAGIKETVRVGPDAANFDQIEMGDRLAVVATEELVVHLAEPGEAPLEGEALLVDLAPVGAKPGGVVAAVRRTTATIIALDPSKRTVTLRLEDGRIRILPVRRDVELLPERVGDRVVLQITEMVALSVEKS